MSDDAIYPDGPQPEAAADPDAAAPSSSDQSTQPAPQNGAAEGELFVTNLLAEIANLTKRAIMAETMVAVLQSKVKSGQ